MTTEAQFGGPYVVITIEGRHDSDEPSDGYFETNVDLSDEAYCDGISTSLPEVTRGGKTEYRFCQRLSAGEGTVDVVAFFLQTQQWSATYRVEGPGQDGPDGASESGPDDGPDGGTEGTIPPPPPVGN